MAARLDKNEVTYTHSVGIIKRVHPQSRFVNESGLNLRTLMREGAPWFVAKDVCDVLALEGYASRYTACLGKEEVRVVAKPHVLNASLAPLFSGKTPCVTLVSESGLYSLILKSRKQEARAFKKWVTSEVLPAIRKDGAYVMGEEKVVTGEMSIEEMTLKVMAAMTEKVNRLASEKAALEIQVAQAAPAVAFHRDYVEAAGTSANPCDRQGGGWLARGTPLGDS